LAKNADVALCGILTGIQRKRNKEGKLWAALQVEDLEGSIEAMVFSTQYERLLSALNEDQAVLVRGLVLPEENAPPKVSIQDIVPLDVASIHLPSLISIRVPLNGSAEAGRASALHDLFERKPGATEVRLRLEKSRDFSVIIDVGAKVRPDKEFCAELSRICGKEALEILAG
jgi:DNA polymerase-3 subunit alpha